MTDIIHLKGFIAEDFVQYKQPAMFLITSYCDFKCCREAGCDICQNMPLNNAEIVVYSIQSIYNNYVNNDITKAIVLGGLEPFNQIDEVISLISYFRENNCSDTFIIYTGYNPDEVAESVSQLKNYSNIIVKFGRFIPNDEGRYDNLLGINLASKNQYSIKIS